MKFLTKIACLLFVGAGVTLPARAQEPVPPPMPAYQPLSYQQLDQLLGPIALYPDPLIAEILPASTFPAQIVLADRYVSSGGDPNQIYEQPWDESVQALARYPNVLQWMDENLAWTTELGQAFLNQQQDVMDSIQRLRQSAYNLGNLQSTPQQQVINYGGYIEIVPVDTQVIYVPIYQPDQVFYQTANGAPWVTFSVGFAIGAWLNCDLDWGNHNLIIWNRDHPRPRNWWHEEPRQRNMIHANVWHPDFHPANVEVYRGDRGWNVPNNQIVVATVSRSVGDSAAPRRPPEPARPPSPAPWPAPASQSHVQHIKPAPRPEPNGAFIGIQSPHETKVYSDRGKKSLGATTHSNPGSHSTTSSGNGGGGGDHGSNSHKKN